MKKLGLCLVLLCASAHARDLKVAPKEAAPKPLVAAKAWILVDVETGRVLEKHNARLRMFPASTTKILTSLVALRSKRIDAQTTIGPNPPRTGESSIHLQQGEIFTVRELVGAAMIKSANDACVAIAEGVSGDVPTFIREMNALSKQVGARGSHWTNPHGLHHPGHYTTANDLALIARAALRDSWFNEAVATRETTMRGNAKVGAVRFLKNRNRLLFRWPECDGVKTGYTRQAGRCLVASASRTVQTPNGPRRFRLLSVVLKSPDSWKDSRVLLETKGFKQFVPVEVARAGQSFGEASVQGGAFNVQAVAARAIELALRKNEGATTTPTVRFLKVKAPVRKGQIVGSAMYFAGTTKLAEIPLVARDAVPVALAARVFPPARALPSNPILPFLIVASATGALALVLIAWKLRAQNPHKHHETETQIPNETREQFFARLNSTKFHDTRRK